MASSIREALIEAGVKNLKTFGYPKVDAKNILTDPIYSRFFLSMLDEHTGAHAGDARSLAEEIRKGATRG